MTGSGMGNFGLGNVGIFGQQEWQRQARDEAFRNLYSRGLQMAGGNPMGASPAQQFGAGAYASSFFPQGSTFTGGSTGVGGMFAPFTGMNISREQGGRMASGQQPTNWWNQYSAFKFPF